jgi:hypothetical protein
MIIFPECFYKRFMLIQKYQFFVCCHVDEIIFVRFQTNFLQHVEQNIVWNFCFENLIKHRYKK